MAALTAPEKRRMFRSFMELMGKNVANFTRNDVYDALDAFQTELDARIVTIRTNVDTATSPHTFADPRIDTIYQAYMAIKGKEGL